MPLLIETDFGKGGYKYNVRKFGRVENAPASEVIVHDAGGDYDGWLDAEEGLSIVSTSPLDTYGGAGAEIIEYTGQGADGIEKTYYQALNGTTPVLTETADPDVLFNTVYTSQCFNVQGARKSPLGISANNVGTITITGATSGRELARILPNLGRTQMMIWRMPADHFGEFQKISLYPDSGKPLLARLWGRGPGASTWVCVGQVDLENDIASITHPFPDYISPGTDLCLTILPEQSGTNVSAQMWIKKIPVPNYSRLQEEGSI